MSDIDPESRTGMCAVCGQVELLRRSGGRWACAVLKRQQNREHKARLRASGRIKPAPPRKRGGPGRRQTRQEERHGLEPGTFRAMFDAQQGRCAVCGVDAVQLQIDHCHATGQIRGLLCGGCNSGLGHLGDDPDVVLNAARYLLAHAATAAA